MVRKKRRVLDIGFGGFTEGKARRGTTIGLDEDTNREPNPDFIEETGYPNVREPFSVIKGDAYALPFREGSLDRTTSYFAAGMHDFPQEGFGRRVPPFTYKKVDPYSQLPGVHSDFDPEEHWEALIESLRVLKPGGTTRHVWDGHMTPPPRKDPYYLALIQLLKNHDMENIKIKIEDNGPVDDEYETGRLMNHYAFILTARKKI